MVAAAIGTVATFSARTQHVFIGRRPSVSQPPITPSTSPTRFEFDTEPEHRHSARVLPIARNAVFNSTHWSTVLDADGGDSPESRAALERLCAAYWYPLYAHVRRRGHGPDDAADLTQEFFATLLRRNSLSSVGPEKGRFRTFPPDIAGLFSPGTIGASAGGQARRRRGVHPA